MSYSYFPSSTITWSPNTTSTGYTYSSNTQSNTLHVQGTAKFNDDVEILGDLKIKNRSIKESLENIEERLAILHPNEELEARWEDLRRLRKEYMTLEQEIIEKEKMWTILKR